MQLTKRLNEIASFVPAGSRIVDVGTDHGYIPIFLTYHHLASYCIASDINKGPLDSAKRHMAHYHLSTIELRQGSGLSTITADDQIEVAIIAGMGGLLINTILENDMMLVKGLKRLILQPQNNLPEVRKFLHANNFKIVEERFLEDEGKYYTVLCVEPGAQTYENDVDYLYGKYLLDHPTELFISWLQERGSVFEKIALQLKNADAETRERRERELAYEHTLYMEALKCIASKTC